IAWIHRLEEEHENLRAAMDWMRLQQDSEGCLRLCAALFYFWWQRGFLVEGRDWATKACAMAGTDEFPGLKARVLTVAGYMAWMQGDYTNAHELFKSGHELALSMNSQRAERRAPDLDFVLYETHAGYSMGFFGIDDYAASRAENEKCLAI